MNALDFCYTLQGFTEISQQVPTDKQWAKIVEMVVDVDMNSNQDQHHMNAHDFVCWIKGFIEICEPTQVGSNEWIIIKDHLGLVFTKVTPDRFEPLPETTTDSRIDISKVLKEMEDKGVSWGSDTTLIC